MLTLLQELKKRLYSCACQQEKGAKRLLFPLLLPNQIWNEMTKDRAGIRAMRAFHFLFPVRSRRLISSLFQTSSTFFTLIRLAQCAKVFFFWPVESAIFPNSVLP